MRDNMFLVWFVSCLAFLGVVWATGPKGMFSQLWRKFVESFQDTRVYKFFLIRVRRYQRHAELRRHDPEFRFRGYEKHRVLRQCDLAKWRPIR